MIDMDAIGAGAAPFVRTLCGIAAVASLVALGAMMVRLVALMRGFHVRRVLVNLLFPLSQLVFIAFNMAFVWLRVDAVTPLLVLAALAVVCAAVDYVLFRDLYRAEQDAMLRRRAAMLRAQLRAQRSHTSRAAREMETARAQDSLIAGRLRAVSDAVEKGDADAVSAAVAHTVGALPAGASYCEHPVADALLALKVAQAARAGIAVDHRLEVPESLPLTSVEICALFSNIMDNAIAACSRLPEDQRHIALRARVAAGNFVVQETNPCDQARPCGSHTPSLSSEHGWGLSILRRIAQRYGGSADFGLVDDRAASAAGEGGGLAVRGASRDAARPGADTPYRWRTMLIIPLDGRSGPV
ncbi:GHKL domain-containing protein [Bifidobacterium lemurum]|nr:GHKL domain-containing protein [Bifidobacterium lemurum]QOL35256.1 GHKL domain-containing protein [Bifidobacterium lemurum]